MKGRLRGFHLLFNMETWAHQFSLFVSSFLASFLMIQHQAFFYVFPPAYEGYFVDVHPASYVIATIYIFILLNIILYMYITFPTYFRDDVTDEENEELDEEEEFELTEEQQELYRGARKQYIESRSR